ncbi:hypothetical protein GOY11_32990 [Pseudomonas aeruginosa]|uniref:hypothetical protein n=1 Tax=Pseudomonas aeruginosa TaxID=287 RepID=UPI001C60905F|nr:hypothetical protein [Pseudomonas aeruginosa]MBW5465939.1 hypothetical protein [Pseudomonas aeruginosa]
MACLSWLDKLKESFASTGLDYEDLYEIIEASITRKRTNFTAFINEASNGVGFSVGEGHFYSLDHDCDDPEEFNEVSFVLGEVETSSIPLLDYVGLMKIAADVYADVVPEESDSVLSSDRQLDERYSKRFPV